MKDIKEIKQLAKQIYEYEKLLKPHKVKNIQEIQSKIEKIIMSLSLEEVALLDDIIISEDFDF